MPATHRVIAITLFVALFGIVFFLVQTVLWMFAPSYAPLVLQAGPMQGVLLRRDARPSVSPGVNAASFTTADRKEQTLRNPVGMLNGQTVFLNVHKNPPQ